MWRIFPSQSLPPRPYKRSAILDDDDMGFNGPQNIEYVNMEGVGLPARFKERIDELEQMLQLTHQRATIHAGIQVRDRKAEGALPRDDSDSSRWKRSQYRARVLDTYFEGGVYPWCNMYRVSKSKGTITHANVDFSFAQKSFAFNEATWRRMKPKVERYIDATGIDSITNTPTADV
ncbi:hypothetical protein AARAC_009859 [Aspergillus arachidicola]|uniref:Uncharacterized protein n=1 Tax=Aspergillus arachidicola TaxID=656916 RepID=A0A2G7G4R3_9EURO|nr:hypothetical protein AARAC_009859 [Aspergillus arachidicola]